MHIKRFLEWVGLKENLHLTPRIPPHVSEAEIWWASLGENVGFEMNGKSRYFSRPVIIFRKLSNQFYYVIPVSTQEKYGTWYVHFKQGGKSMIACLSQARAIDYRRLSSRLGNLDDEDSLRVKEGFRKLYL